VPGDEVTDIPAPRRRTRRTVLAFVAVAALAVVALGVLRAGAHRDEPGPHAVASMPPTSPDVVSAGYLDSRWRLTAVADTPGTTEIPASIDAWLELAADGTFIAFDSCNTISGTFDTTSIGFDITDPRTTLAGCVGTDPDMQAAITGIGAMTWAPAGQTVHTTVLSADHEQLTAQASGVRLTFDRTGPAGR
jgi:heat shock protein HslJ